MNDMTTPPALAVNLTMTEDIRKTLQRSEGALATVQSFQIDTAETAQMVAEEMNDIKARIGRVEVIRDGFVKPAQQILDNARNLFNPALSALRESEKWCKGLLVAWSEKERQRIELETQARRREEMRLRQEGEARAASERAKAQEKADKLAREAREAEATRQAAEAAGNTRAATAAAGQAAKLNEQAAAALETGHAAAQDAVLTAAAAAAPLAPVVATKINGVVLVDKWTAELLPDMTPERALELIVASCATDPRLYGCLALDLRAINGQATSLRSAMSVPGFVAVNRPYAKGRNK